MTHLDDALQALAQGGPADMLEGPGLEFKQEDASLKKTLEMLADAVVCLANADGGTVVLGVSDRPTPAGSITGVNPGLSVDVVVRGIFDRTRPALSVPVAERYEAGARLLVITVPRGATLYSNARGTATRRVGTECRPFPPEEQRQALAARGLYDWSAEPSGLGLDALHPDELTRMRGLLRAAGRDDVARLDDARLLHDMRLLVGDDVTRAAIVLLGREDAVAEVVPTYGYAYQHRPSAGSEATARLRERRPLLAAVDRLLDAVDARRSVHPLNISGGVQLQLNDYPSSAVRELVVNALVHRDYEFEGGVEIEHTPERLVVTSPGGLVFGVTPDNILSHPSTPRNRLLLEVVTVLQVAERTGQGVDRVYRELLRIGKQPPSYRDDGMRVVVDVAGGTGNDSFARFVSLHLEVGLATDLEVLLALSRLRDARTISAEQLAPGIQRTVVEAQQTLERMTDAGLIAPSKRTARRSFPTYSLTSEAMTGLGRAVAYHRRGTDDRDQKVVEHVNEYGHITNQTLRRLFDLDVPTARDMLRDLQQRGVLVKLDERSSGPGVRYGLSPERDGAKGRRRSRRPEGLS